MGALGNVNKRFFSFRNYPLWWWYWEKNKWNESYINNGFMFSILHNMYFGSKYKKLHQLCIQQWSKIYLYCKYNIDTAKKNPKINWEFFQYIYKELHTCWLWGRNWDSCCSLTRLIHDSGESILSNFPTNLHLEDMLI